MLHVTTARNKVTFKRTRRVCPMPSVSNTILLNTLNNNVCACAVSALILLPVVNLSFYAATSIFYTTWKVSPFDAAFRLIMAIFQ